MEEVVWLESGVGVPKALYETLGSLEDELFGDLTDEEYEALLDEDNADTYEEKA